MIVIDRVERSFGTGSSRVRVLKEVSARIEDGDFVVILGASGSGKSTFLNIASGLDRPDSGSVLYDGRDIAGLSDKELTAFRREKIGFIFQQYYLLPGMTAEQNVRMGADLAKNGEYRQVLQALGLGEALKRFPSQLSGGQQQRVAVARALAKRPQVLFLDEPTGALDEQNGRALLGYLSALQKAQGFTVVMVTHNQNIAQMARTVIQMNSGQIVGCTKNEAPKSADEIGW